MNQYKIILVHGYLANPEENWFPHFKKSLEQIPNVTVEVPAMPDSHSPDFNTWLAHLKSTIRSVDEYTIFVGHSLGCVTLLNFLDKYFPEQKVKSLYLVSGFVERTPLPELSGFVTDKLNYQRLISNAPIRTVISAIDDDIVPYKYSQELAEKMKAEFILLQEGKHFISLDGFTEFPELVTRIREEVA